MYSIYKQIRDWGKNLNNFASKYCKVRNISVELLLATLASGSDSLILRSVHICSI